MGAEADGGQTAPDDGRRRNSRSPDRSNAGRYYSETVGLGVKGGISLIRSARRCLSKEGQLLLLGRVQGMVASEG